MISRRGKAIQKQLPCAVMPAFRVPRAKDTAVWPSQSTAARSRLHPVFVPEGEGVCAAAPVQYSIVAAMKDVVHWLLFNRAEIARGPVCMCRYMNLAAKAYSNKSSSIRWKMLAESMRDLAVSDGTP